MKTKLYLLAFTCLITISSFSQSSEKVKGNRNVTTQTTEIETFNHLVISDNFKINIKQGDMASVEVNTDDNLHEVIAFSVQDGRLSFKTTKRITSKKAMEITVVYKDSLSTIELKEDAELTSLSDLNFDALELKTRESTKAYLTFKANSFKHTAAGRAKAELNVTAKDVTLDMSDNSTTEALINADTIKIEMLQRSKAEIEGDVTDLIIDADNNVTLKAEKLTTKNCSIVSKDRADIHVEASKDLIIEASGNSEIYIYGSPKIELKTFEDNAILRKE